MLNNLRIILLHLDGQKAEVQLFADGFSGQMTLHRDNKDGRKGWRGTAGIPDDLLPIVAQSLFGKEGNGPVLLLPQKIAGLPPFSRIVDITIHILNDGINLIIVRGEVHIKEETTDHIRKFCISNDRLSCFCPYKLRFESYAKIVNDMIARLRAENNDGLPIQVCYPNSA